jgi:hypothetical protein
MAATAIIDAPPPNDSRTVHVIATSLEGTRAALHAATALARGFGGRVVLFLRREFDVVLSTEDQAVADERDSAFRQLAESYTPRASVFSCVAERATDVMQLFQAPGLVVICGNTRLWWPTSEQRLARTLTRLGCQVTFVHVPHGRFVSPLTQAVRERPRETMWRAS